MDSWLGKSHDNGNKRTADDVEAAVNTNANREFANEYAFCTHWAPVRYHFFPLNNYYKYTTQHGVYYFNRDGSWKFFKN